ncbi:MAG: HAD-IA family hydrolase [Candidatus Woesearchaeota archaeon]
MTKLLIFDFDGVIADSLPAVVGIINSELNHHIGSQITPEEIRAYGAKALFRKFGISGLKMLIYSRQMHEAVGKHLHEIKPCMGMKELLQRLKFCKLAIVTSNSTQNAQDFLESNSIKCFTFVLGGVRMFGKESKLRQAMKLAHSTRENTLFIGDEVSDIEAAKRAGVKIAAVTWGFNSKELLEKGKPDYLIDKPEQLLKLI